MATGQGTYNLVVRASADRQSFENVKRSLQEMSKVVNQEMAKVQMNQSSIFGFDHKELQAISKDLTSFEQMFSKSFSDRLGSINLTNFNQALKNSNINLNNIAKAYALGGDKGKQYFRELTAEILSTNRNLKETKTFLDGMATTMGNTIKWGISSSVMNSFTGSVEKAYGYVKNLDKSLNDIRIVSSKSAIEMEKFAQQANKAAQSLGSSTLDYTNASLIYYQQGLSDSEVQSRTDTTIKMANVLGAGAAEVSDYMTAIWNNFADGSKSLEYYADVLAKLGAETASSAEEISTGLEKFAAISETVGLSYEYATAALTTVTAATRQSAEVVGTAFKTLFARIQDLELGETLEDGVTLGKYSKALDAIGIDIIDVNGNLKSMDDILNEMGSKWDNLTKAQQVSLAQTVAGTRQYTQLVALMDNWDDFQQNVQLASNATGSLNEQQEIYMDSAKAHLESMSAAFDNLYDSIFNENTIKHLSDLIGGAANAFAGLLDSIGGGENALATFGSMAASIFSKNIGQGLSKVVMNSRQAKENMAMLAAEIELVKKYGEVDFVSDEVLNRIVKMKKDVLEYGDMVSDVQHNETDQIINTTVELEKQHDEWVAAIKAAEEYGKTLYQNSKKASENAAQEMQDVYGEGEGVASSKDDLEVMYDKNFILDSYANPSVEANQEDIDNRLDLYISQLKRIIEMLKSVNKEAAAVNQTFATPIDDYASEDSLKMLQKRYNQLGDLSSFMATSELFSEDIINGIYVAYQEIQESSDLVAKIQESGGPKSADDEKFIETFDRRLSLLHSSMNKLIQDAVEAAPEEHLKTLEKIKKGYSIDLKNKIDETSGSFKNLKNTLNVAKEIQGISELVGGLGQLFASLNMLANIKNILSNDQLSSWERALQLGTALASAFTTLKFAVTTLSSGWKDFTASVIKQFPAFVAKNTLLVKELDSIENLIDGYKRLNDAEKEELKTKLASSLASNKVKNVQISSNNIDKIQGPLVLSKTAKAGTTTTGGFAAGLKSMMPVLKPALALLGKIAIAAAAIVAVAAIIYAIEEAIETDAEKIAKLEKASTGLTESANKTKESIDNLKNSFNTFESAQDTFEKCARGTDEWDSALRRVNSTVLEILEKYPQLASIEGMITTDSETGALQLNKKLYNDFIRKQEYALVHQQMGAEAADYEAYQIKYEKELRKIQDSINFKTWRGAEFKEDEDKFFKATQENFENLFKYTATKEEYDKAVDAMMQDADFLENIDTAHTNKNTMATYLKEQYAAMSDLRQKYEQQQVSEQALKAMIRTVALGSDETDLAVSMFANNYKEQLEKEIETFDNDYWKSGFSRFSGKKNDNYKNIVKAYDDAMGGTGRFTVAKKEKNVVRGNNGEDGIYVHDKETGEDVKLEKDVVQYTVGSKKALEATQKADYGKQADALISKVATAGDINQKVAEQITSSNFDINLLTPEEYAKVKENKDKILEVFKSEDWSAAGKDAADNLTKNFEDQLGQYDPTIAAQKIKEQFENAISAKATFAENEYELDKKEFSEYAEYLSDIADESDRLADSLEGDADGVSLLAKAIMRMNRGIEDLAEGWENWNTVLRKSDKTSAEYWQVLSKVQDAFGDILDLSEEAQKNFDSKFIASHLDDINLAAKGNADAINRLRNAFADYSLKTYLDQSKLSQEIQANIKNTHESIQNQMANLEIGIDIVGDVKYQALAKACQDVINTAQMTKQEANKYFDAIGFEATYTEEPQTQTYTVPLYTTYERVVSDSITDSINEGETNEWKPQKETMSVQTGTKTFTGQFAASALSTSVEGESSTPPTIKTLRKKPGGALNNYSNINPGGAKLGGGGSKPKKQKTKESAKDRYHDVNVELKNISNSLEKVQDQTEQLTGQDKIDNLREQYELLNQEIETTAKKIAIAKDEMSELQQKLSEKGIKFNEDGTIANYAAAYDAQLAYVNNIINQYNGMSEDGQEAFQQTLDTAEENFDKFIENINRYDELITDMIPGLETDIQDAINEQIELKIEAFHQEIEIRLDMAEAEREWNEFYKKIIKDIDEDDILGNATERLKDFISYYKESAEGVIQVNTEHINQILSELKAMDENGVANVYGKNGTEYRTQALEDLQNYYQQLMSDLTDIHDLSDEIHESYVDMIDEAQDKFDEQIETFEKVNELLEHDKNVISMINGEESYSALAQYYDKQEENNNKQLDFQKQQVEFWKQQMEIAEEGSDAWEAAKENWMSAVDEWNSAVEAAIENLQEKYLNAINAIFQNLNNQVTNGLGLDYTESQWELINKNADQYLDSVNSIYQVQQLQNKYLDAIEKTDSPAQQKRLNDLMKQETDYLREQDKLSQYDLDRANLKYEIALKQMALEEAQQNKTMLRLRRDSQGNYTYQYTADEDQISSIQQEIADLYNQLYNLDAEEYRGNLEEIYDVWLEFQERMAEAAQINDPEQRAAKELLIKEQYGELINTLVEKNENTQANLYQSTMSHLFDLYNQNIVNYDEMSQEQRDILDQFMSTETDLSNAAFDNLFNLYNVNIESFKTMTDEQKDILMGSLVPQWDTAVQMMVDNIAGAGGFLPTCREAFEEIDAATQDYMSGLEELQEKANISFEDVKNGIDETIIETEKLLEDNNELISSYEQEIEAIRGVIDELEELISKYQAASDAAKKATEDAYNYWLAEQDKNATIDATLPDPNEGTSTTTNETPQPAAPIKTPKPSLNVGSYVNVKAGSRWYRTSYGGGDGPARSGSIVLTNPGSNYPYNIDWLGWVSKSSIQGYDTGGYTGDWGSKDGRLAMLHQKELVLNASDTQNVLNAVEILRDITSNLGNTLFSRMAAISAGGASAIANGVAAEGIEQNVHIDAQFPNVTNSHEIEDALNNLMNRASQFIQQSR